MNLTLVAIAAFAGAVALVMLAVGPSLMGLIFGGDFEYERGGLVLVSVAMGLYLSAATVNQALLAQGAGRAGRHMLGSARGGVRGLPAGLTDRRPGALRGGRAAGRRGCLFALLHTLYRRA